MANVQFGDDRSVNDFLKGKPKITRSLYHHFIEEYKKIGEVSIHPTKTMIGIATPGGVVAYVTQLGRRFVHIVFPFDKPYTDNLCFQKIARVPGDQQFNHHLRLYALEDINDEVKKFMKLAYQKGQ
jgi:hypothetical protein